MHEDRDNPELNWLLRGTRDGGRPAVVAYWDEPPILTAYAFAVTEAGVVDLVGFAVAPIDSGQVIDFVNALARQAGMCTRLTGLTSRQVRSALAQQGLLARARAMLAGDDLLVGSWLGQLGGVEVRRPIRQPSLHDRFFAELVVDYAKLLASPGGGGARQRLARARGVAPDTVKNWMTEAKRRGFWVTSGPGKPGQPTPRALGIVRDTTKEQRS